MKNKIFGGLAILVIFIIIFLAAYFLHVRIKTGPPLLTPYKSPTDKLENSFDELGLWLQILDERVKILENRFLTLDDSIRLKLKWIEEQKETNKKKEEKE